MSFIGSHKNNIICPKVEFSESVKSGCGEKYSQRANKDLLDSKINFKLKLKINKFKSSQNAAQGPSTLSKNKKSTAVQNEATQQIKLSLEQYAEKIDNLQQLSESVK